MKRYGAVRRREREPAVGAGQEVRVILALIGLAAARCGSPGPSRRSPRLRPTARRRARGPRPRPIRPSEPDVEDLLPGVVRVCGRDDGEIALGLDADPVGLDAELRRRRIRSDRRDGSWQKSTTQSVRAAISMPGTTVNVSIGRPVSASVTVPRMRSCRLGTSDRIGSLSDRLHDLDHHVDTLACPRPRRPRRSGHRPSGTGPPRRSGDRQSRVWCPLHRYA